MKDDPFIDEIITDEERQEKGKEITSLFTEVYSTDAGKLVLQYIEKALSSLPIAPESDLYKIGVRDGRRDALYQIKKNIKG